MTLVVVKIAILNQCRVIYNKITVEAAIAACGEKKNHVNLLGG